MLFLSQEYHGLITWGNVWGLRLNAGRTRWPQAVVVYLVGAKLLQGWGMGALLLVLVAGGNMYRFWKYEFGNHLFDFAK